MMRWCERTSLGRPKSQYGSRSWGSRLGAEACPGVARGPWRGGVARGPQGAAGGRRWRGSRRIAAEARFRRRMANQFGRPPLSGHLSSAGQAPLLWRFDREAWLKVPKGAHIAPFVTLDQGRMPRVTKKAPWTSRSVNRHPAGGSPPTNSPEDPEVHLTKPDSHESDFFATLRGGPVIWPPPVAD
jgi:hypothetical protein